MADRTYTKSDIEKYLKVHDDYLNGNDTSNAFENIHEVAIEDLKGFIDGSISITPDSFDTMQTFIDTFAGGYNLDDNMKRLHQNAMEKLNKAKEEHKKALLAQELDSVLKAKIEAEKKAAEQKAAEEKKAAEQKAEPEKPAEKDKIKGAADRIILLFQDVNNNKSGRLDSIQKELSALSGVEIGALYKELDGRENVSNTVKRKFKQQLTYNLEGKYLVKDGKEFAVNEEAVNKVSNEDAQGYMTALDGVKEGSYNVARIDTLYAAFLRKTELEKETEKDKVQEGNDNKEQIKEEDKKPVQNKILPERTEELRARSAHSDDNEILMYGIRVNALTDMGIISEEERNDVFASDKPEAFIDLLQSKLPSLSDEQMKEMESRMTDLMLEEPQVFEEIPPRVLAQKYNELKGELEANNTPEEHHAIENKLNKFAGRIDTLIEMLAKQEHNNKDLFFADVTNIADAHEGYMEMFEARKPDLEKMAQNEETKEGAEAKLAQIEKGKEILDDHLADYKRDWNLAEINEGDANKLDARFEDIQSKIKDVELTPETLKLVSNFKFLDAEGNVEPQFIDKDGNKSDVYTEGAKIIEGSKLDQALLMTKQHATLLNLGSNEEITPEFLAKEVNDKIGTTLYTISVCDNTSKGVLEHPNQFTDPALINDFMAKLANPEKPTKISHLGFEAAKDAIVNQTGAYASCLGKIVGKDKPVVTKLFNPIAKIDSLAKDRTVTTKPSAREAHIEMLKRKGMQFGMALGVSTGLTLLTAGTNKAAGAIAGVGLGVVLTGVQIHKWRKQQKKEGKPAGLWAMIKDRKLRQTVETTALAGLAAGFAATGNPGLAAACGIGAMAVGTTNGIMSDYQAAKDMGLGKGWAAVYSALTPVATLGGGYLGSQVVAPGIINAVNKNFPDNTIFQHKENIPDGTRRWVKDGETQTEVIDKAALEADSSRYNQDYGIADRMHPGMTHEQYMQAVKDYNLAHPDAPITHPDNLLQHAYNAKNVYGPGWQGDHGVSAEAVKSMANLFNADGSINQNAVNTYNNENFMQYAGLKNFVGHVSDPNIDLRPDLYPTKSPESTYSDMNIPTKNITTPYGHYENNTVDVNVANPHTPLVGMFGILRKPLEGVKKLKERAGSLLDRIMKKGKRVDPPTPIIPDDPVKPIIQDDPVKPIIPDEPVIPVIPDEPKKDKLLIDEYKIVYGTEPTDKSYDAYYQRVEKERLAEAKDVPMDQYLLQRREKFDTMIKSHLSDLRESTTKGNAISPVKYKADYMARIIKDARPGAAIVAEVRQSLQQSNLTPANYTGAITLTHFGQYAKHFIAQDEVVADGSRRNSLNPVYKKSYKDEESKVVLTDLNAYLVDGKPLEQCQERPKGRDLIAKQKDLEVYYARKEGKNI